MTMGATLATLNGQGRAMSAAPVVVAGRAMLPLREVGRFFNADVQYNASTRTVFVNTLGGADSAPATAPGAGLGTAGSSTGGTGAGAAGPPQNGRGFLGRSRAETRLPLSRT